MKANHAPIQKINVLTDGKNYEFNKQNWKEMVQKIKNLQ